MTERRCPSCGGLVAVGAEWCPQCFTRLDRPVQPRPETPTLSGERAPAPATALRQAGAPAEGRPGIRSTPEGIVWGCPTCLSENPIEATSCLTCGTPFGRLMEEPPSAPKASPGRAVAFSLIFPGLGHFVAGRGAEGLARAVIFGYALATTVMVLVSTGGRPGPFLSLLVAAVLVGVGLYGASAADAARAARGEPPLLTARLLLYGGAGLILLTVVILVVAGLRASGAAT